ncbi:hypothetical protein GCM10007989_18460 [Devosia pacifica]|uniref:DUF2628 domain-containing protein n=1 Tax=Devosia pacifica TaxID=1335967 RepID=A0A918S3U0_9HYPH|nr:DUF2628 domain-containing protein [Devosia pacifica]GHA23287.1 hypothetical protein GCM10007989_18460 [Devosia pacifica]
MTLYAVFEPEFGKRDSAPLAVAEQFDWLAFLLPPAFFVRNGLWLELVGFVVAFIALRTAGEYIGADATFWLYWLGVLWLGFAAPSIRRAGLRRAGWRYKAELTASAPDTAQLVWLKLGRDA